jgi:hypothetical protein
MPGQNIMEGEVILHETLHELHTKKLSRVILKIYFGKAYDKVNGLSTSKLFELRDLVGSGVHGLKDLSREEVWASKLMVILDTTSEQKS